MKFSFGKFSLARSLLLVIAFAGFGVDTGKAQPPAAPTVEGNWSGVLNVARTQLRLTLSISRAANGQLQGSVAGLDNGSDSAAIEAIEQSGKSVKMVVGVIGGGFAGELSDDGSRLTGTWSEIAITTPLELFRSPVAPSPVKPSP